MVGLGDGEKKTKDQYNVIWAMMKFNMIKLARLRLKQLELDVSR
jgi:hypothetical protein